MKEMTHKEVKQLQLDILSSVHDFCDSNGLRYSLAGGTLLGAVRHKGFIPWDDDIDILMPRPDYELFIQKYQKEHHVVQNYITDKGYFFLFTKIYDDRTTIIEDRTKTGVCIDVFPVDGLPNKEEATNYIDRQNEYVEELKKNTQYFKFRKGHFLKLRYYIKLLIYPSRESTIKKLEELHNTYKFESSSYAGAVSGMYGIRELLESDVFKEYIDLPFEDRSFKCLAQYDKYLTSLYGDYMLLPPEEKRVGDHNFTAYWND